MLPKFITGPSDLVTSRDATREGFLAQALAKSRDKAPLYVQQAKDLLTALKAVGQFDALLHDPQYYASLLAAAGLSVKASRQFPRANLEKHIEQVLGDIITEAGPAWPEEIVYRYLLTKGDALGGAVRNWIGAVAQRNFTNAIKRFLPPQGVIEDIAIGSGKLRHVDWEQRRLYFDVKPRFINNSVDVVLLDTSLANAIGTARDLLERPEYYLACGELKGGIDPAGADEHWKTAISALRRIRTRFVEVGVPAPKLFFVGAAIEVSMANEIFRYLQDGTLDYAANLTVDNQLSDLAQWLVTV